MVDSIDAADAVDVVGADIVTGIRHRRMEAQPMGTQHPLESRGEVTVNDIAMKIGPEQKKQNRGRTTATTKISAVRYGSVVEVLVVNEAAMPDEGAAVLRTTGTEFDECSVRSFRRSCLIVPLCRA